MVSSADRKPALVLVHGYALDSRMWRPQVEAFADTHRILLVDLPGFGLQARALGEVQPGQEIARAMDAAGLAHAHVVGASYGAAAAVDLALQAPKRLKSLTLVGPALVGRRTGIDAWTRCVTFANEGDRASASEALLEDPMFDTVRHDEELFEEVRRLVLDYSCAHWTGAVASRWSEPDPVPRLKALEIPAMIVSGEADLPSFMLMAEAYAKNLPRARREIIQGVGHLANLEAPATFNELLRAFLTSLARAA